MEVFALVRTIEHPQAKEDPNAPRLGDIVEFRRTDKARWGKELKHFAVVKLDLTIPCGEKFKKQLCRGCKDNSIETCDVQKYLLPEFSSGGVTEEPRVLKKRRYQAKYTPPEEIKNKIDEGLSKTAEDEQAIVTWADNNLQQESIIHDKKVAT